MDNLNRYKQLEKTQQSNLAMLTPQDNLDISISNLATDRNAMLSAIARARQQEAGVTDSGYTPSFDASGQIVESSATQGSVLPGKAQITQRFGAYNPGVEVFSKSGVNYGTDFGVKEGTPLALPPGQWQVVDAYQGASGRGYIGNKANKGYGNSVLVRNAQTGETMRFSHLKGVNVQPGKTYQGGTVLGTSGATGNVTGPHLDLEYKNPQGQYQDVTKTGYASYLFGQGGGQSTNGKGGGVADIKAGIQDKLARIREFFQAGGERVKESFKNPQQYNLTNPRTLALLGQSAGQSILGQPVRQKTQAFADQPLSETAQKVADVPVGFFYGMEGTTGMGLNVPIRKTFFEPAGYSSLSPQTKAGDMAKIAGVIAGIYATLGNTGKYMSKGPTAKQMEQAVQKKVADMEFIQDPDNPRRMIRVTKEALQEIKKKLPEFITNPENPRQWIRK